MLRTAIIGLGNMGMLYDISSKSNDTVLSHAKAVDLHSKFELVVGVDVNDENCKMFEKHYGVNSSKEYLSVIKLKKPDVVIVCVPTEFHCEVITKILNTYSPKFILCEKPLAYITNEANKIVQLCKQQGVSLGINYMRRFDSASAKIKQMIELGEIKMPFRAAVWYSKGALNNSVHLLNLMAHWFGSVRELEVTKVVRPILGNDFDLDYKVKFDCGDVYFQVLQEENFTHYSIEIIAQNGRLRYEDEGSLVYWQQVVDDSVYSGYRKLNRFKEEITANLDTVQMKVLDNIEQHINKKSIFLAQGHESLETESSLLHAIKNLKVYEEA